MCFFLMAGFYNSFFTNSQPMLSEKLLTMADLDRDSIDMILRLTSRMESFKDGNRLTLAGKIVSMLFFESSTRTRMSFEAAAHRLGASVIGFADPASTRGGLGESAQDVIRMASAYSDVVVVRHPTLAAAQFTEGAITTPLINAGDGLNNHPTQTLLDLYTIQKELGRIDGRHIGIVGGLKHSRAAKSLCFGLAKFNDVTVHLASPRGFEIDLDIVDFMRTNGVRVRRHENPKDLLATVDALYVVRVQRERFESEAAYASTLDLFRIDRNFLKEARPNLIVLHCLPRTAELPSTVDDTPHNKYFAQASNGVAVRMALLATFLRKDAFETRNCVPFKSIA